MNKVKKILKAVYGLIPFKCQIFSLLKTIYSPKESLFQHLHFKGDFMVELDKAKSFKLRHFGFQIENEIFWKGLNGGWEKVSIDLWKKLSADSDVIIDIGANTGVFALISKAINEKSQVYAFEPIERVYDKLVQNIKLNEFDIKAYKQATSNYDGNGVVYDVMGDHVYSVTVNKNIHPSDSYVEKVNIELIRLDSFIKENNISKIDLMKIDVETHEPEVLEGMGDYLQKFQPTLLIEVLNDEIGFRIQELVKNLDYLYFNINEDSGVRQVDKILKSDYFNYLLCKKEIASRLNLI
jgi:FkbM family methyltransferase